METLGNNFEVMTPAFGMQASINSIEKEDTIIACKENFCG